MRENNFFAYISLNSLAGANAKKAFSKASQFFYDFGSDWTATK
jgi:hypothetical protein